MDATSADITLHRLVAMLPVASGRAAAWPGRRGPGPPHCTLQAGDARLRVRVERVSVAGAHLLAPTVGLVELSAPVSQGASGELVLRVRHPSLDGDLEIPCVLVGAAARGAEHAMSVRFRPSAEVAEGLHGALQLAFDQRSQARRAVREDVVPVVVQEAWRGRTLRGVLRDLSADGLGLALDLGAEEPPEAGEPVHLRFRLPGQSAAMSVHATVRSVRARPVGDGSHSGVVDVGLAIAEAQEADRAVADRLAEQLGLAS